MLLLYFSSDACSNKQINGDTMLPHIFNKNTALKSLSKHNLKSKSAILESSIPLELEFGFLKHDPYKLILF